MDKNTDNVSVNLYDFLLNISADPISIIVKREGSYIIESANDRYCELFVPVDTVMEGRNLTEIWGQKHFKNNIEQDLERAFDGEKFRSNIWRRKIGDRHHWFITEYYPLLDDSGKVSKVGILSKDVTDTQEAQIRLDIAKNKLIQESNFRKGLANIASKFIGSKDKDVVTAINQFCRDFCLLMEVENVMLIYKDKIFAQSACKKKIEKKDKNYFESLEDFDESSLDNFQVRRCEVPGNFIDLDAELVVLADKDYIYPTYSDEVLKIIANILGLGLQSFVLDDQKKKLRSVSSRYIFIDPEKFKEVENELDGKPFRSAYLVADVAGSVKLGVDQSELQRILKSIAVKYGAVWGNSWGDMIHTVFTDIFNEGTENFQVDSFECAIAMVRELRDQLNMSLKVGISIGDIKINEHTIQMNQTKKSKIIEKAWIAQEGRPGITMLQKPPKELKQKLKNKGYVFKHTKDVVRGELRSIWKLYPIDILKTTELKQKNGALGYNATKKLLLTKGSCFHGHFEGCKISPKISEILKKASDKYDSDENLAERFNKLTGVSHRSIIKKLDKLESWGEANDEFDFVEDFLPWLYIMKMGEGAGPEFIYELNKEIFTNDLNHYNGLAREIYPLVWIEMGHNYDECVSAYVEALNDAAKNLRFTGPVELGVGVKRSHLVDILSKEENEFLHKFENPYMKTFKVLDCLKKSDVSDRVSFFTSIMGTARYNPLFNTKNCRDRESHVERYFEKSKDIGAEIQVHLLEELPDKSILSSDDNPTKELDVIINLLKKLDIQKPRLIHMAYWPEDLPYLKDLKSMNAEIAVCQTSTRVLGSTHDPVSPFLLKNKKVVDGLIKDEDFPLLLLSTDDSGPFCIREVWEEYLTVRKDLNDWYDKKISDIAFIQFLRNSYKGMKPEKISSEYKLDLKAVEWVLGYDLYEMKKDAFDVSAEVSARVDEMIEERKEWIK